MEAGQERGACNRPRRVSAVQDEETVYKSYDGAPYKLCEATSTASTGNLV